MTPRTILSILIVAFIAALSAYLLWGSRLMTDLGSPAAGNRGTTALDAPRQIERASAEVAPGHEAATLDSGTQASVPVGSREMVNAAPDLFELVRSLASKAYNGDAEAQLTIARAMALCNSSPPLPEERPAEFDSFASPVGEFEAWARDAARCEKMRHEDPFAALPPRDGGYPFEFWMARAVEAGHPLAAVIHTESQIVRTLFYQPPSDERDMEVQLAQATLARAASAGTAEHHFYVGRALAIADEYYKPGADLRGVAWVLMSCRAGGCTNLPERRTWSCPPGVGNYCDEYSANLYQFEQQLGADRYSEALQLSYEIEDLVKKARWADLNLTLSPKNLSE